jgi:hypothetical protein
MSENTSLREAIESYREPTFRCISNQKNPPDHSTDNALLFSATYLMMLNGPTDEWVWFSGFVRQCEVAPGLYNRYPGATGLNAWDDLIGIAAASFHFKLPFASEIYQHAMKTNWSWNNSGKASDQLCSFLGRYPQFPAFLMYSAGVAPSYADQLSFAASCVSNAFMKWGETSTPCLQWLMNSVVKKNNSTICNAAIAFWEWKMQRTYPGGLQAMYQIYFGPAHPLTAVAGKDFK